MTAALPLPSSGSVDELIGDWVLWQRARGLSVRTITERAAIISRLPDPVHVTAAGIDRFLLRGDWTKSTRATYHQAIRAWCRWLITTGRRTDDPTILAPPPKVPRGRPRPLAAAHLSLLLASVNRRRTCAMILLAAYAGLRVSEIAAVRGDQVDLLARTITVVGKGDKQRTIPLHQNLIDMAAEMPSKTWWFPSWTGNHTYRAGGPMLGNSVSAVISSAMDRAGIPGTPHALRHWFGSALRAAGVDTLVIKELMGHNSLTTTAIYVHIAMDQQQAAIATLPDLALEDASNLARPQRPIARPRSR